ncbi:MAG: hypothetical protein AB1646_24655 [Thermodesulfobacteriota bacterium]
MPDSGNEPIPEFFDASPYLKLTIDKDGRWFQNGAEIIHREIYLEFNRMLERAPDGGYRVRLGREVCRVHVEDAPFVVQRVVRDHEAGILIELNDATREPFDPERFWIGDEHIPYVLVKDGLFHARFSRPAYYQIAEHIVSEDDGRTFCFVIDGHRTPVSRKGGADRVSGNV